MSTLKYFLVAYDFVNFESGRLRNHDQFQLIVLGYAQQGRIHGNPVADGWAGAVMRKPLGIQKCDVPTYRPTYRPTRQVLELRVRD